MRVFIGWSGERSQKMALILRDWIRLVVQPVKPWCSPVDIASGAPWGEDLQTALKEARFAVLCVTPENYQSPWLNYECGHLAGRLDRNVCPLLLGVQPSELQATPLSRQQARSSSLKDDVRRLVHDVNATLASDAVPTDVVDKVFDQNWEALALAFANLATFAVPPQRSLDQKVDEILAIVTSLQHYDPDDPDFEPDSDPDPSAPKAQIIDLFEALKKSLDEVQSKGNKPR